MALDDFIFFAEVIDSDNDNDSENEYNDYEYSESDSSTESYSPSSCRSYRPSSSNKAVESDEQKFKSPIKPAAPKSGNGCMWTSLACIIILFALVGLMVNAYEGYCRYYADCAQDSVESENEYTEPEPLPYTYEGYGYEKTKPTQEG